MATEWNKSMSTEGTLAKFITAGVMAEATIGGWRTSADESYPDPHPGEIIVLRIFIGVDLGIHAIPLFESCATIIGLASTISTQTLFLLCPFLLPLRVVS
jgi:hypothetical protein